MSLKSVTWDTAHGDKVEVYPSLLRWVDDQTSEWGWRYRVRARNGRIVEQGSEGYVLRRTAVKAAERHHPRIAEAS